MPIQDYATDPMVRKSQLKVKEKHRTVHVLGSSMHGQDVEFKIKKNVEKLAQDWLIFDVTRDVTTESINTLYLAACIMSSITIRNASGSVILDELRPERIIHRLESMSEISGMYNALIKTIEPPQEFTTPGPLETVVSCTLKLPLMFFYSMVYSEYLDIRETEDLFIRCRVNSAQGMRIYDADGVVVPLTNLTVSLVQEYYTKNNTYANLTDYGPATTNVARPLNKTFSAWFDRTVTVPSGSNSYEYELKCNIPTNNMVAIIFSKYTMVPITAFKLSLGGTYVVGSEYEYITTDIDYNFSNQIIGNPEQLYLHYNFDQYSNNVVDSTDFLTFSKESNMCPAYLTLKFDTLTADAQLYVFHEVPTSYSIASDRSISINKMTVPDFYRLNDGNMSRSSAI